MNISDLVNAPVKMAISCWDSACRNKGTIAKVTAGAAVIASAAFLYSQQQNLYRMQDALTDVADSGGGLEIGLFSRTDFKCPSLYTPYRYEVELNKLEMSSEDLLEKVRELYNNATSFGTDLFSDYEYRAKHDGLSASFIICRSSLSNLFSAPWRA